MSLRILKKLANDGAKNTPLPTWVSGRNLSLRAYECINKLNLERLKYISTHNKLSDYKKKNVYQISASEVARTIKAATPTLISTSAYSSALSDYLRSINKELEKEKELKLSKHRKTLSSGMKQRKKDEITNELQIVRSELERLKKQNTEDQIKRVLETLSLPVKRKLGIDV